MRQALQSFLGLLAALCLPARYAMLPASWTLFFYFFYSEPVLRLPLLAYLAYILSPTGRHAVGTCRWPTLLRRYPLYRWCTLYAPSRLVKTADLDPLRRFFLGIHPHGVIGNSSLLALGTEGLGWSSQFPGIRLSQGARQPASCRCRILGRPRIAARCADGSVALPPNLQAC